MNSTGETLIQQVSLPAVPNSLDEGTRQLPGGGYTTLRTYDRLRVLRIDSHFQRLEETARLANSPIALDRDRFLKALQQAVAAYQTPGDVRVRVILDLEKELGTVYILIEALHTPQIIDYQNGVKAVTRPIQRHNPKAKLTNFITTADAVRRELPPGINEAIMVSTDGNLLEGLSSNFYAVINGVIWTAEKEVLSGITRSLVLDVVREAGIPLRLEGAHINAVPTLEEAFISSASRAVLPVTTIDGQPVGSGHPGPLTNQIMTRYQSRLEAELDTL